jgi:nicotinamide mononucleotide transporter
MNDPLVLFGLFHTSWLEIISFVLAVVMVYFNIRQSPWGWLFGISSAALYAIVFYGARLYGDMGLQFFFIAVSLWGWYQWLFGGAAHHGVRMSRLDAKGWSLALAGWLFAYLILSWFLRVYTDTDVPHLDAFLTAGSLVGQFLLSRKKIENWHVWIFIDLIYIGLYIHKNLMLTAVLFAVFVAMAIVGLLAWKKALVAMQTETPALADSPAVS